MQKKDQIFARFCEFKALVEKDARRKVKSLGSDKGGEYVSNEFKKNCALEYIRQELITPHNPHQNGVDKRKNISVGVTRVMLHD